MDEPASWLLIRPGWKVYAGDGSEVGEVDEVTGDDTKDIFNGLAVATSALGKPRYVTADQVSRITQGAVQLSLSRDEVEALDEYLEPATSAEIEADNRTGPAAEAAAELREIGGGFVRPVRSRAGPLNVWRRMYLLVRRLIGR
jgi:hypothetical protein